CVCTVQGVFQRPAGVVRPVPSLYEVHLMLKALPLHVAAGVCAMVVATATPLYAQADLKRWYFAEGSTNTQFGFEQEILIANPTAQNASVTLRFLPQDGSTPIVVPDLKVKAHSR